MAVTDMQYEVPLLEVKGLGKIYTRRVSDTRKRLGTVARKAFFRLGKHKSGTLSQSAFWAVRDVNFELRRGSAIGIIGLNGSGKTTLLRMLAGQILPDAGQVLINGSSAAMIDLQAGFQASASGRENIFLRAAALGFTRKETQERLDEIIAFSELGDAIGAPMSTYSSGMKMRLAFSVMTTVSPDLLLIDEVLAVGDFQFRQKCLSKVREMRDRSAFVFVSHSMADVERFCDSVIVMHKGDVYFSGDPKEAIAVYEALEDRRGTSGALTKSVDKAMGPTVNNSDVLTDVSHVWCDMEGNPVDQVAFDAGFQLRVRFKSGITFRNLSIGVPAWAVNAHYITGLSTQINSDPIHISAGEQVEITLTVEGGYINPGVFKSMLAITDGPEFLYRNANPDLTIDPASHPTWGSVTVPHKWQKVKTRSTEESGEAKTRKEA